MTKELQDHVWSILPKEFKEEVKKEYRKGYVCETLTMLITLFGHHNLTSDAEGEDEMLCVSRKDMQFYYQYYKIKRESESSAEQKAYYKGRTKVLLDLFGSKCLPDNVATSAPNVDSSHGNIDSLSQNPPENCNKANHISTDDSKPAEPTDFGREVNFPTKNNLAIYLKKSKNCDNRLQIAAVAMQGILSNIDLLKIVLETGAETLSGDGFSYQAVAKASLLFADALIAESEKRSEHGK